MTYSKPASIMGGSRKLFKKKSRKNAKKQNKPNWITFVTNYHKQQTKKNKNWSFKNSLKNAKKYWKKEKKGGSCYCDANDATRAFYRVESGAEGSLVSTRLADADIPGAR